MAPRPVSFSQEVTETRATTPKNYVVSSPSEDVFCILETNDGRTQIGPTLFVSTRRLKEQR
jgi:hypothetical protein